MGTSTCQLVLGDRLALAEGMCGVVEDGIVPGLLRLRGRAVGGRRHLRLVHPHRRAARGPRAGAARRHRRPPRPRTRRAPRAGPARPGLLALDWWNGNRSILVDVDLSGLLLGATLATGPADIYRALLESTAFGTRAIIESLDAAGVAVDRIVACGGSPGAQRPADAAHRRHHRPRGRRGRVEPGARRGLGDVRRGRGRMPRTGATTRSRRPPRRWPGRTPGPSARTPAPRARTTGCTASTSACTTTSGAAATTS